MQIKKALARLLLILFPFVAKAQTTYLPKDDKANILIERMEIKFGTDSMLNFSKIRPYSRKSVMEAASLYKKMNIAVRKSQADAGLSTQAVFMHSKVDAYNLQRLMMNNLEWLPADERAKYASKKPILKNFYTSPANLYEVHIKDFDLVINPVIQFVVAKEKDNDETLYLNTRGLTLRGKIAIKIGFYTYMTDNQEKDPFYVRDCVNARKAVPGAGFYKQIKQTSYDYFDARGYITFNVTKYINVAFGYDKNFIGNGYRSMFLVA